MRRTLLNVVLPLGLVAALSAYVWSERDQLEPLTNAPLRDIVAIGVLVAAAHFLNSSEFWLLYRAQGVDSGIGENWLVFLAANLGNYLPAQAGALYRIRYMRTIHDVAYSATVAVYGSNLIITLIGASFAGLAGAIGFSVVSGELVVPVIVGYVALLVLAAAVFAIPLPGFLERRGRVARAWQSFRVGFDQTRESTRLTIAIALIEALKYFVTALRFLLAFRLLGFTESYWFFLALAPAAGLAQFVSFTPGAIGFREGFLAATALALGAPLSTGLLAATADRAVMLATSVLLGSVGFAWTYPRLRRAELALGDAAVDEPTTT